MSDIIDLIDYKRKIDTSKLMDLLDCLKEDLVQHVQQNPQEYLKRIQERDALVRRVYDLSRLPLPTWVKEEEIVQSGCMSIKVPIQDYKRYKAIQNLIDTEIYKLI